MFRNIIISAFLTILCTCLYGQQPSPRVAGLESNAAYMSLLSKQQSLRHKEDSINGLLTAARADLRANPDRRVAVGEKILQLESAVFDVRSEIGVVSGRINSIEQEYVLSNLGSAKPEAETAMATGGERGVMSSYLLANLSADDMRTWAEASSRELPVYNFVRIYLNNYKSLGRLAASYGKVSSESAADSVMSLFRKTEKTNAVVADTIAKLWHYVFDNKSYLCNLLMDKANNKELLESTETRAAAMRAGLASISGRFTSDAVGFYRPEKTFLLSTELSIAQWIGDAAAADSLKAEMKEVDALADPLSITIAPRNFIVFEDVNILPRSPYTSSNPIPAVRNYSHGTLYRILLGAYLKPQSPSIFRNAAPLSVMRGGDGRYLYFAGCLASEAAADKAVALLRKAGFRSPETVMWRDGKYLGRADGTGAAAAAQYWKVEITAADPGLTPAVKELIATIGQGRDVSRTVSEDGDASRYVFTVGSWDDRSVAVALAEAIRAKEPALAVTVKEVPPAAEN